jgi:hypothetical protein
MHMYMCKHGLISFYVLEGSRGSRGSVEGPESRGSESQQDAAIFSDPSSSRFELYKSNL